VIGRAFRLARCAGPVLALAWLAMAPASAAAQKLQVQASLDRTEIALGEEAMLSVTVTADGLSLPPVDVPAIQGVELTRAGESQGMSFVNGRITRSLTVAYRLHPHAAGVVTIPPIRVTSGGTSAASEALTLRVGSKAPVVHGGGTGSGELFVRLTVDRNHAYWNEQVLARFTLYSRAELASAPIWDPPDAPGFWTESMGPPRRGRVTLDGVPYDVVEIRIAYFPTRTGKLVIGPGRVHLQVVRRESPLNPFGLWALSDARVQEVTLETDRATVEVAPLPPGAPDGFHGAVGRYNLGMSVDRFEVHAGEPVTVVTSIRGEGNISSAGDPDVSTSIPTRSYSAGASTNLNRTGDRLSGERRHEVAFIPEAPGRLTVLPVRFAWFDPEEERYRVQSSDSISINVLPPTGGADSLHVARSVGPLATLRPPGGTPVSLSLDPPAASRALAVGSLLAYLGVWGGLKIRARADRSPLRVRRRGLGLLLAEVERAEKLGPASAHPLARAGEALLEAVALRYRVDIAGRSIKEAMEVARHAGTPESETEEIVRVLEALERAAFAPGLAGDESGRAALRSVGALIHRYQTEIA
jgi:hypothetical protein